MKRCLALISALIFIALCHAQALKTSTEYAEKYTVNITFKKGYITGICAVRDMGDEVAGSVINEFGIKAFDFIYNKRKRKTKLKNVIKMIDKWYIRRIVSADMSVLFREKNTEKQLRKRSLRCYEDSIILENQKYNIIYRFQYIDDIKK